MAPPLTHPRHHFVGFGPTLVLPQRWLLDGPLVSGGLPMSDAPAPFPGRRQCWRGDQVGAVAGAGFVRSPEYARPRPSPGPLDSSRPDPGTSRYLPPNRFSCPALPNPGLLVCTASPTPQPRSAASRAGPPHAHVRNSAPLATGPQSVPGLKSHRANVTKCREMSWFCMNFAASIELSPSLASKASVLLPEKCHKTVPILTEFDHFSITYGTKGRPLAHR